MKCDPAIHHRRSVRLQGYDYSRAGAYFITICTQNRACLFGEIHHENMVLNDAGRMLETVWHEIPEYYSGIGLDAFQIMPNHIHGIIIIVGAAPCGRPDMEQPPGQPQGQQPGQPQGVAPTGMSLPDVIHRFKTMTTKRYADGVKQRTWPRFDGKLWQRNYYEHIIRSETELNLMRQYIIDNPIKWPLDKNHPGEESQQVHELTESYEEKPWMI